jgi:hypothetical protein
LVPPAELIDRDIILRLMTCSGVAGSTALGRGHRMTIMRAGSRARCYHRYGFFWRSTYVRCDRSLGNQLNREIYNYCALHQELERLGRFFRSNSDIEALINAVSEWGLRCPPDLTQ